MLVSNMAKDNFGVLKELKRLEKINGSVRRVNVEIEDNYRPHGNDFISASEYGYYLDTGKYADGLGVQPKNYHFSDGNGEIYDDIWSNPDIRKSVDGIVSGKRRPSEELDRISEIMAKEAVQNIVDFIDSGAHRNYQSWKGTNSENLQDTGNLRDSIVGSVVHTNGKTIWRGR